MYLWTYSYDGDRYIPVREAPDFDSAKRYYTSRKAAQGACNRLNGIMRARRAGLPANPASLRG